MHKLEFLKSIAKKNVLIAIAVLVVVIAIGLIVATSGKSFPLLSIFGESKEKLAQKAIDYINNNNLSSVPASLVGSEEVSGLIKVRIKIGTNEFDSYVSKDGKLLFPQAFDMSGEKKSGEKQTASGETAEEIIASMKKTDKPMIEAFIVSRCPFGLQMQRMIADAIKSVPELAQYVKVEYIGEVSGDKITAMHGEEEATENLRQICIREEQPTKYWDYVACQMKTAGTETSCESSTAIDSTKLSACMLDMTRGVAYAQKDFALDKKYNIQGSPTLVLNGTELSETSIDNRSSEGVKSIVCSGFDSKPSFCSQKLNTISATTGFSESYSNTNLNSNSLGTQCGN